LWLVLSLAIGLTAFFGSYVLEGSADAPTGRLFDSRLAPTPTSVAAHPTATPALATRPPATPSTVAPPKTTLTTHTIRLPLMLKQYPWQLAYGWKAVGDPGQLDAHPSDGFWGIYLDWWYNWGASGPFVGGQGVRSVAETLAGLEAGLQDPRYVPMIWCMADVNAGPTPAQVANLARQYPGRVWLVFNEPDNLGQCGLYIDHDPLTGEPRYPFFRDNDWTGLGTYLAEQYILYYDAIKDADPYARIFALGLTQLPMPGFTFTYYYWYDTPYAPEWRDRAIGIWNGFTGRLMGRNHALDGIAIHAYGGATYSAFHDGCVEGAASWTDYGCVQSALTAAHRFFQGTDGTPSRNANPDVTAGKTIWITEIGVLRGLTDYPGYPWTSVRDLFEIPMRNWFNGHIRPGQDCQYINTVSWFSTHFKVQWEDATASNLLDHLQFAQTGAKQLTPVGQIWRDWTCANCQCPGPDCP